ncbi:MAG: hypothetical protein V4679_07945 [Pseudomonadota bacterium]
MNTFPTADDLVSRRLANQVRKLESQLARLHPQHDAALHTQRQEQLDLTRATLVSYTEFLAERPKPPPARSSRVVATAALPGPAALIGLFILSKYAWVARHSSRECLRHALCSMRGQRVHSQRG